MQNLTVASLITHRINSPTLKNYLHEIVFNGTIMRQAMTRLMAIARRKRSAVL